MQKARNPSMNIVRATHLGMCFGVRDAIALALEHADAGPLTILGDLVHNSTVTSDLRSRGVVIVHDLAQVATETVMVTAHGASDKMLTATRARGLSVVEATCPLVHVAHKAVRKLVDQGYHPVIVGQAGHVEVRGLTGDLDDFDIVLEESDVLAMRERARIGVAAQTTQPIAKVRQMVALIRERFPRADVRFIDTVCKPTKDRQDAAVELARQSDVVIVVGGASSNNTRELVRTCSRHCARVHHVQSEAEIDPRWLDGADTVGITAGTSTPDAIIDRVEHRVSECARDGHREPSVMAGGR
jgi:4-hydroxy-3-methylbut-2-en-1-yl diphosphate reductase